MYGVKIQHEQSEKDLISYDEDQTVAEFRDRNSSRHRRSMLCFNISVMLQLVILVVTSIFCLWLYTKFTELKQELERLKNEPSYQSQASRAEAQYAVSRCNHTDILDYHSSLHDMINSHHGIANSEIAHIYGDEQLLRSYLFSVPQGGDRRLKFTHEASFSDCSDSAIYLNSNRDVWCAQLTRFAVGPAQGRENYFRYFKQASWMAKNPLSNYEVKDNCKIKVKSYGMYQLHAHMQFFMHAGSSSDGSMRVMKKTNDTMSTVLGACYVEATRLDQYRYEQQYHCSVYQVSMLHEGDEIYIDVEAHAFFSIHPDQLHLTVIKLNDGEVSPPQIDSSNRK